MEMMDFGRAAEIIVGHITEGAAGYKDQQQYEQEQEERSRKQVIVFHFDNADPDRGMIRAKAEEAIGKEMADEGEAEDPVKGAEIAKREAPRALVGPAKTESRDAQEIDAFDLVIRFNYKEIGVGTDPDIKGLLCDVSYYNSAQAKYIYKTKPVETFHAQWIGWSASIDHGA